MSRACWEVPAGVEVPAGPDLQAAGIVAGVGCALPVELHEAAEPVRGRTAGQ